MRAIDVHSHLQFAAYDADRAEVLSRMREAEVGTITVGTQTDTSRAAVELAEKEENVWAAVGLHPIHTARSYHDKQELGEEGKEFTSRGEIFDYEIYKKLAEHPKVVAIGECGLDYFRLEESTKKVQRDVFEKHIALAIEVGKPLMLHVRNGKHSGGGKAYDDVLDILEATNYKQQATSLPGNVHFFAGDWETAKKFLDIGFLLSFTGVLTFTNDYDEVIRNTPLDMLLAETDAPYITPVPHRGKRNEPQFVLETVKRIAEIKNEPLEIVESMFLANARRLYLI